MAKSARSVSRGWSWARGGFSLIELLVVIVIIALIIGIVLPALANVRDLAKKTTTDAMLKDLSGAVSQFRNDKRRLPGYFNARDMGALANADRGMSGAENMMLDLGTPSTAIFVGNAPPANSGMLEIGPVALSGQNRVWVDPDQIGNAGPGSYFTATGRNFVAQTSDGHQISNVDAHAGPDESARQMKDLVDAWGQPLLVWSLDEASGFPVANVDDFARVAFNNNQAARFYVNQNICFLNATQLGKRGANQTDANKGSILSTIPAGNSPAVSLCGLLGNPSSLRSQDALASYDAMLPSQARGSLVIQSAGSNGVYLGRTERGAKSASNVLNFGLNYKSRDNSPNQNAAGVNQATDIREGFDDLVTSVGN